MGLFNKPTSEEELMNKQYKFDREQKIISSSPNEEQVMLDYRESKSDLFRWQQDLQDEVEFLKNKLRGKIIDPETNQWVYKVLVYKDEEGNSYQERTPPLANEDFIDLIELQLQPFLSRNLINTNFDEKRILTMLCNTMDDIADIMADGWDRFEINFINYDVISRLIKNVITPTPFRALRGWTKNTDNKLSKRVETHAEMPYMNKQKGGFFNYDK